MIKNGGGGRKPAKVILLPSYQSYTVACDTALFSKVFLVIVNYLFIADIITYWYCFVAKP